MVQLRFFASLRETLGVGDEQVVLPDDITDISALTGWLQERNDIWHTALGDSRVHVAVNQVLVKPDCAVNDGDEVAWFPPVTGG
ncbi:MAG: molybdopterin converting factor subunit 1 [Gammaproteobacteria bacterium]|nr:MAG: molybdopterin converting factor subunit 1 [Gammaproteobacteria bacterium]